MSAVVSCMEGLDVCAEEVASGRKSPDDVANDVALLCCAAGPSLVRSLERYYFAALRDASEAQARKRLRARAAPRPSPMCEGKVNPAPLFYEVEDDE